MYEATYISDAVSSFWDELLERRALARQASITKHALTAAPKPPYFRAEATAQNLQYVVDKPAVRKARGLDRFSVSELKLFGEKECGLLAQLYPPSTG